MSRNIGERNCRHCDGTIVLVEKPRSITEDDAGYCFPEYGGMLVANAECPVCLAQYLAWVDAVPGRAAKLPDETHLDLSYRSSFNDEPGERDLPRYQVETQLVRVGPFVESTYLRLGPVKP